jgi:hypothetical protein
MLTKIVQLRSIATSPIRKYTTSKFLRDCFQEVRDRSFIEASDDHTLVYLCVFCYGGSNRWMAKWGKTDCSVEKRFYAHRHSYGIKDVDEYPPIIPLILIKCKNSKRREDDIKNRCKKFLHKVKNMNRVDSTLCEQTHDIAKAYDEIKKYCTEKELEYWSSVECEINEDNNVKWKGKWISVT